jgi:hypothetical protein
VDEFEEFFDVNEPSVVDLSKSTTNSHDITRKLFNSTGGLYEKSSKPKIPRAPQSMTVDNPMTV